MVSGQRDINMQKSELRFLYDRPRNQLKWIND